MLVFEPSHYASCARYKRPDLLQRQKAATSNESIKKFDSNLPGPLPVADEHKSQSSAATIIFPAPLILPGDDLALDPRYPAQSLRSWMRDKNRNAVTPERNVIYVAAPPQIGSEAQVSFLHSWSHTVLNSENIYDSPKIDDVIQYLSAYYYGLTVRILPDPLEFISWKNAGSKTSKSKRRKLQNSGETPSFIGLKTSPNECTRIRIRNTKDGTFPGQLNLNDLLDTAISILPDDAYALLLLVKQDLYEDDDDEFVCGRAYGGSRIAVVSSARYHPILDVQQGVDKKYAWPASHLKSYMDACCSNAGVDPPLHAGKKTRTLKISRSPPPNISSPSDAITKSANSDSEFNSPLHSALAAHDEFLKNIPPSSISNLWLYRVCRTASHELGHCFGMDHCVYYACMMQGSASLAEDARQPPYLCPIDLTKILRATGVTEVERDEALIRYCEKHVEGGAFLPFHAWLLTNRRILKASDKIT